VTFAVIPALGGKGFSFAFVASFSLQDGFGPLKRIGSCFFLPFDFFFSFGGMIGFISSPLLNPLFQDKPASL